MNCAAFEILLADFIDGALPAGGRDAFVRHLESCSACAALAEDARAAVAFMERAWEVEPPPALLANILQATNAGPERELRGRGFSAWINRMFAPVLQPRLVLGAMMTIMSVAMIGQIGGPAKSTFTAADLNPVHLWTSLDDNTNRLWDRAVKDYESTRLVYEVKEQVDDWTEQQRESYEATAQERK
jgi:anti-sigma factor RsiW